MSADQANQGEDFMALCVAANRDGWELWHEGGWYVVTDPQGYTKARVPDQLTAQMNMVRMWKEAGGKL